jgi:hypothetical protein
MKRDMDLIRALMLKRVPATVPGNGGEHDA